jgi:hypothetical protein
MFEGDYISSSPTLLRPAECIKCIWYTCVTHNNDSVIFHLNNLHRLLKFLLRAFALIDGKCVKISHGDNLKQIATPSFKPPITNAFRYDLDKEWQYCRVRAAKLWGCTRQVEMTQKRKKNNGIIPPFRYLCHQQIPSKIFWKSVIWKWQERSRTNMYSKTDKKFFS